MYKRDLDTKIKEDNLPKSILLYGEDYFCSYYTKVILSKLGGSEDVLSFYFDEYDYKSAKSFIAQSSLFSDVNILFIKGDKKINKKELDDLVTLSYKNRTNYFIYHFSGDYKVASALSKSFTKKNSADFVRFFKPNMGEGVAFLKHKAKELNLDIDNYALSHLFLMQNEDLSLAINELDKLTLLNKKITSSDIDKIVYGLGEISMDDFITKLLSKQDICDDIKKLIDSGIYDEIRVISSIESYITNLFMFYTYIKVHGRYNVKDIMGFALPNHIAQKRASQAIKLNLNSYNKLFNHLLETEYRLKKMTNIDKNSYLISALIKFQSLI